MSLLYDFISLFYPRVCMACGTILYKHEEVICTLCLNSLPFTNFHLEKDNPVSQNFWGRIKIENATAMFYFNKGSKVQHLIHQLKYKNKKEVGIYLGYVYGNQLKNNIIYNDIDIIIPVPLHYKKLKKRGYNQSEMFGLGVAEAMKKPLKTDILRREIFTDTQTHKSRINRWENVKEIFKVKNSENYVNKHFLLIDDVVTTGATLEACVNQLLNIKGAKVSIACIAVAKK